MQRLPDPLILLLGGKSERAGLPKGLRDFQGHAWLEEQLVRFRAAGGERAIVVLGFSPEGYLRALEAITVPGLEIQSCTNPHPECGPFSSIQTGLSELRDAPGAFIQPIDVPCPGGGVWQALTEAGARHGILAASPLSGEKTGHPVWISRALAQKLLNCQPTSRLDEELKRLPVGAVARASVVDPSVRMNLNTPEQWADYQARTSSALEVELGHDAGVLSLVEAGIGSVVHAFHVPGAGQLLSLNQAFLLSRSTLRTRSRSAGLRISTIAALLKSLSPAGKKLTPMMAISIQGALFSVGTGLFGANLPGVCIGAALLSVWAFAQPLLVSYLIFGKSLFSVAQFLFDRTTEILSFPRADLIRVVFMVAAVKAVIAASLAFAASVLPETLILRYFSRLRALALAVPSSSKKSAGRAQAFSGALKDVSRPVFLFSLALTFVFLLYSESPRAAMVWGLLRPLALGYLIFLVLRLTSIEELARRLGVEPQWRQTSGPEAPRA